MFRPGFIHRIDDSLSLAEVIPFEPFAEIKDGDLVVKRRHKVPLCGAADGEEVAPLAVLAQILRLSRREIYIERRVRHEKALFPRQVGVAPVRRGNVVRVGHDKIAQTRHERCLIPLQRQHAAHHPGAFVVIAILFIERERHRKVGGHLPLERRLVLRIAHGAGSV